jgi:transcriptional regulator with XRE-family HTH domain
MKRKTIADRLRIARAAAEISQSDLAHQAVGTPAGRRLGCAAPTLQTQISRIEAGHTINPGILTLEAIAAGLGITLAELIGD